MTFSQQAEEKAKDLRAAILRHPFVTGIGDGTLDVEKFKFYVRQDYLYLIDYSRVLALASARSDTLESMSWFAHLLHQTLNTEMELHRDYCRQFGISRQELEETLPSPTTTAYTQFLLSVANSRSYPELVAALLPCQWGYWEIGSHLNAQGPPKHAPLYAQWIEMYASEEFHNLALWVRNLADELADRHGPTTAQRMEEVYLASTRYEYLFWEAPFQEENWPR